MIVAFSRTVEQIRDKTKTVTRRRWNPTHARWFTPGREFEAWTAGPHRGGLFICPLWVVSCRYEPVWKVSDPGELIREGGLWKTSGAFADAIGCRLSDRIWRLEFSYRHTAWGR